MSAARRHKKHHHEEHDNHERWLVSGFDMMTLLFAVFVVLFAISSTNVSKIHLLQQSLKDSLSGPVFTGGRAMMNTGAHVGGQVAGGVHAADRVDQPAAGDRQGHEGPGRLRRRGQGGCGRGDQLPRAQGPHRRARRQGRPRRQGRDRRQPARAEDPLLTDDLFFASGSATIQHGAVAALAKIGGVLARRPSTPIQVEGHTDDSPDRQCAVPVQLAAVRCSRRSRRPAADRRGVAAKRVTLTGYASEHPVAPNTSARGRAQNRRVEIVLTRLRRATQSHGGDAS